MDGTLRQTKPNIAAVKYFNWKLFFLENLYVNTAWKKKSGTKIKAQIKMKTIPISVGLDFYNYEIPLFDFAHFYDNFRLVNLAPKRFAKSFTGTPIHQVVLKVLKFAFGMI